MRLKGLQKGRIRLAQRQLHGIGGAISKRVKGLLFVGLRVLQIIERQATAEKSSMHFL